MDVFECLFTLCVCVVCSSVSTLLFYPRALSRSVDYLIASTYALEHTLIYSECVWWQAKTFFSFSVFFVGVTLTHHMLTINKIASVVLAWLHSISADVENYRAARRTASTVFLTLFLSLNLANRICFWCTARLLNWSRADLRRLYRCIPIINHRPWGTHFVLLYRFRLWLYRFQDVEVA